MVNKVATLITVTRATTGMILRLMLTVLSADLLYLYYGGHWYDPNPVIEMTEVVLFYCFAVGGIIRSILRFLRFHKEYDNAN